ncbi:hypothetical protein OQA88_485 [Cercophora sp. LCS_1]
MFPTRTLRFARTLSTMATNDIPTPARCYADFCLVPVNFPHHRALSHTHTHQADKLNQVGTGKVSVAEEVAAVQRLLKGSGLKYTMHSAGTTVGERMVADWGGFGTEGSWDDVMRVIGQAHSVVHKTGAVRIQTSMRVGTRTDKTQTAEDKVKRVREILGGDQ